MAAEFIGVTVLVTLHDPPNAKIRGLVTNVVENRLILHDGELWRIYLGIGEFRS